jgi:hypothetical protein
VEVEQVGKLAAELARADDADRERHCFPSVEVGVRLGGAPGPAR